MYEIWTFVSVLLAVYSVYFLAQFLFRNKKLPPGPVPLPILGNLHLLGDNPHKDMARLSRKHGPIMYLQLGSVPTIVVSSPAGAELVLKTHDHIFANRPHIAAVSRNIGREHKALLMGHYGPTWRHLRKLCTQELLSPIRVNQFHTMRKAEVSHWIYTMRNMGEKATIVDISAQAFDIGADIMCLMLFGEKFPNREMDDTGFKAVVADTVETIGKMFIGDYFGFLNLLDLQGLGRRLKESSRRIDVFFDKIIENHYENYKFGKKGVVENDIVDTMISMMESGKAGFDLDLNLIKSALLDMFIAGVDTNATTVEWALTELLRHPMVMEKLQNEIELIVGMEHMVEESHLEHLQYLDAVVKEVFRLHPPAPLLLPHESMEDCLINNEFHIPEKTRVIVNIWAIGRDPQVWDDPESFTPERFIGKNIDVRGQDFKFLPFGAGRRICPGLQLGFLMVRLVVAQLVHCFSWELPNNMLPDNLDMSEHFGIVTSRAKPLLATATYRVK